MKNGSFLGGKNSTHIYNTCPFDSVYAVFTALYADREEIRIKIDQLQSKCAFSKMIASMFTDIKLTMKNKSLLRQRSEIVAKLFEGTSHKTVLEGLTSIDCACNVNYITPKLLPHELYSLLRTRRCERCGERIESYRCYLDYDIDEFALKPMSDLNSCILASLISEKVTHCECGGDRKLDQSEFSDVIMVDLNLRCHIKTFTLGEIPQILQLLGLVYDIYACIEYIGDGLPLAQAGTGHYLSHILRSNKGWECYDDTKSSVSKSNVNKKISGQTLFYIRRKSNVK